ncbi:MAG: hypothetical protein Kow00121_07630 [Elainellaceae cyanobacterium]
MSDSQLTVPPDISFEKAIDFTHSLLSQMEQETLSDSEIQSLLAELVSSENGARGFFVTYLTDDRSLADQPSEPVIQALQSSPAIVSDLLVKNLAMSTAMAISHRRNSNLAMAQGSERVQRRSLNLIERLQLPEAADKAQQLHESATTGLGDYHQFLDRWHYDAEQRQAIRKAAEKVVDRVDS